MASARRSTSISRAAALLAVALVGAGAASRVWQHGGDRPLRWNDASALLEGVQLSRPAATSFTRTPELRRFLAAAAPGYPPPRAGVAAGRQAILVATGARSSDGYEIVVLGVREERGRVVVSVREATPGPGAADATLTFPYRLVEIAAAGKPAEVEWQGRP